MKKFIPFLQTLPSMTRVTLVSDSLAGIVVALILIPQSIAYAQLAGLPPQQGLYAALVAPVVAALFGSSTKLSTGPVAIISLITASAFSALAITDSSTMVTYGILLAVFVGLIQLIFGFLKLGVIVNFISHPVMIGFSNAGALIIATSQLPKVFGIKLENYEHHYQTMYHFLVALPTSVHLISFLFAFCAIALILVIKKIHPLTPGVLIAMIIATCISWAINFESLGGSVVGNIPAGLPHLSFLSLDITAFSTLFSTALIISILGFMESISIAKSLALKSGEKIDANQEFIGQGLANVVTGAVQGYPVAGSFSRSAVNFQAGAVTGVASIITGMCVLLTLLFLTPLLHHLPQSVLSAIIIASVINLINLRKIVDIFKVVRSDGVIALITFIATLFYAPHLDQGIFIGIILSTAYYIYRRTNPTVLQLTVNKAGKIVEMHSSHQQSCRHILMIRFDGSLFFANAAYFENRITNLLAAQKKSITHIIFDAQGVNYIDSSGIETLEKLHKELKEVGVELLFVRMKGEIQESLKKIQLYKKIRHNLYESRTHAIKAIYTKAHEGDTEEHCTFRDLV